MLTEAALIGDILAMASRQSTIRRLKARQDNTEQTLRAQDTISEQPWAYEVVI